MVGPPQNLYLTNSSPKILLNYYLLKYIEILNDLNLLTPTLYKKIKYGTEDDRIICLLQEGLSLDLSLILTKPEYSDIVCINTDTSEISITEALIPKMKENKVNDILIFEAGFHITNKSIN